MQKNTCSFSTIKKYCRAFFVCFLAAGRPKNTDFAVRAQRSAAHALAFFVATGGADTSTTRVSVLPFDGFFLGARPRPTSQGHEKH